MSRALLPALVAFLTACVAMSAPASAQLERPNPDDVVSFAGFVDPVDLTTLVDFVSRTLGVNIFLSEPNLGGATVQFRAPMDVRAGDLMNMLELLLESRNFAITEEGDGWYVIRPNKSLPANFGDKAFATTQIFTTPLLRPTSLQPIISNVLPADASPRVVYSDALGVIISTAAPRINRTIQSTIEHVQAQIKKQQFHRIEVEHIAADEARTRVLSLLGQQAAAAPSAPAGAALGAAAATATAGAFSNLPQRLLLDRRGNAIFFHGTSDELTRVEELVALVDVPSKLVVKRYNAGPLASDIAYFGARQGLGAVQTGMQQATEGNAAGSMFVVQGEDTDVFTYFGTKTQHERVQALVDKFAQQARDERVVVEFYKLENISADDASSLLTELISPDQQSDNNRATSPFLPPSVENTRGLRRVDQLGGDSNRGRTSAQTSPASTNATQPNEQPAGGEASTPGGGGATPEEGASLTPSENVQITSDPSNNQIIVRAPVKQQREIAAIIRKIDQRRPQVMLDVQIVSISISDSFSLSIDTALNPGLEQMFQGLGDIAEASFIGGSTSVIIDAAQTPFVISAIASAGNTRVVSQPGVLVNDNETATVASTTDISFAQTTQVAGAPSQTSVGGTLSAGTNITITPTISAGGFITLELNVELSSFGQASSGGSNLPPDRSTNSIESVITVPGDSTVVAGGLISEQKQHNETKVPFLGDIPIIGNAFKTQSHTTTRSMIYVFITPRVLRDPTFADLRLLTKGPAAAMEVEVGLPPLQPAEMPVVEESSKQHNGEE